jgi:FlaA1/EpsC-like NDP-sugar epimerase
MNPLISLIFFSFIEEGVRKRISNKNFLTNDRFRKVFINQEEGFMSKEDKVRVALIGVGSWSNVLANAVQRSKKAKMVTCYTRKPEKREAFSKKYGCDQEKSFENVLKRDDVEGILLTTPNAIHV